MKEFEAAVDIGVPLLASKLAAVPTEESATRLTENWQTPVALNGTDSRVAHENKIVFRQVKKREVLRSQRKRYRPSQVNWNYVWMPFAACVLLTIALGITAYRVGKSHNAEVGRARDF